MSGVLSEIGSLLFSPNRSIGGIIPDLTVREEGVDELEITQHPVETGYAITDHAFLRPPSLHLEYGWSSSFLSSYSASALLSGTVPDLSFGAQKTRQVYEQLLALQASRVPFQVVTGKRLYSNMLLESVGIMTDASTENSLLITASCRGIIIVSTQTQAIAPIPQQAIPASTAGATDQGTVQPTTASEASDGSAIYNIGKTVGLVGG